MHRTFGGVIRPRFLNQAPTLNPKNLYTGVVGFPVLAPKKVRHPYIKKDSKQEP